ncbi:MAG: hypothetical protein AB8B99_25335 [Phormidesmis sp.]
MAVRSCRKAHTTDSLRSLRKIRRLERAHYYTKNRLIQEGFIGNLSEKAIKKL